MQNIIHWLTAAYAPKIGPIKIQRALEYFKTIDNLFTATPADLKSAGFSQPDIHSLTNPNWQAINQDLEWATHPNHHILTPNHDSYPILLKETPTPPLILYIKGNPALLSTPQIAIVGSRTPTTSGKELAQQFSYHLAQAGFTITSGLAKGIDAASHQGALVTGKTIAVLGTGVEIIYPPEHRILADKIAESGVLLSEYPLHTPPLAKHFPRRNRIISGLSVGVLVIEAAMRSGSLITARYAVEQGREVFAIPGSIHNPLARGCHYLIRQGAKLVETAKDVIEELGSLKQIITPASGKTKVSQIHSTLKQFLTHIDYNVTPLETIIMRSRLTVDQVSSMLLALELEGYVHVIAGGYARLA